MGQNLSKNTNYFQLIDFILKTRYTRTLINMIFEVYTLRAFI